MEHTHTHTHQIITSTQQVYTNVNHNKYTAQFQNK